MTATWWGNSNIMKGTRMQMVRIQINSPCGLFLLCSLISVLTGCGSGGPEMVNSHIKGKVTYRGTPVTEGMVSLTNDAGTAGGQAEIKTDGTFQLEKRLPAGLYAVAVLPPMVDAPSYGTSSPGKVTKEVANIPYQYRSSSTSQLKVEVEGDDNDLKIDMK